MKKIISVLFCIALLTAMSACSGKASEPAQSSEASLPEQSSSAVQIPNPIKEYETVEKAVEALGFTAAIPSGLPDDFELTTVSTIDDAMLQLVFANGEDKITYRCAKASETGDISGDYNSYASESKLEIGEASVAVKGSEEGAAALAVWENDGLYFSVSAAPEISAGQMTELIESIS